MSIHTDSTPEQVMTWLKQKYGTNPMVLTTSFGLEGCALIDLCAKLELPVTVADVDTGFLFEETIQLRSEMASQYKNLHFATWRTALTVQLQSEKYGDRLWESNPDQCCRLRKVLPLEQHIGDFQVWITAIRRSQSEQRTDVDLVQWDWNYKLLKVCPFALWSRDDVWRYVQENRVPHNRLHYEGYPSIGCTHCTQRVVGITSPADYSRAGRWTGTLKTECGLHTPHLGDHSDKSEKSCC